jgi:hypothetical protein
LKQAKATATWINEIDALDVKHEHDVISTGFRTNTKGHPFCKDMKGAARQKSG